MYYIWIVKTNESCVFIPKSWSDNPKESRILVNATGSPKPLNYDLAVEFTKTFNSAELENPLSVWAIITKESNLSEGQLVRLESITNFN